MRGIDLLFTDGDGDRLCKLLDKLPLEDYKIALPWIDTIRKDPPPSSTGIINMEALFQLLTEDCVLEMTAYFYKKDTPAEEMEQGDGFIETYEDFLKSNCEMAFLVCDCGYVEFYAKEKEWVYRLIENAEALGVERIEIKTNITDGRYRLYI